MWKQRDLQRIKCHNRSCCRSNNRLTQIPSLKWHKMRCVELGWVWAALSHACSQTSERHFWFQSGGCRSAPLCLSGLDQWGPLFPAAPLQSHAPSLRCFLTSVRLRSHWDQEIGHHQHSNASVQTPAAPTKRRLTSFPLDGNVTP